jgi:hypothetical protein
MSRDEPPGQAELFDGRLLAPSERDELRSDIRARRRALDKQIAPRTKALLAWAEEDLGRFYGFAAGGAARRHITVVEAARAEIRATAKTVRDTVAAAAGPLLDGPCADPGLS